MLASWRIWSDNWFRKYLLIESKFDLWTRWCEISDISNVLASSTCGYVAFSKKLFPQGSLDCTDSNRSGGLASSSGSDHKKGSVRFQTCPKTDPLHLRGQNPDQCRSTSGFFWFRLDPSVPIGGSCVQVFQFTVTLRYSLANHKTLRLIYHCSVLMYWPPL
jgi:hypothetical protein